LWLLPLSQPTNAQTTVDPITGQVSIVIDPATGQTLNITQNQPLDEIKNNPTATNVSPWLGDDGRINLTLPFQFEYYGEQFNHVWMMSNGVLSFTGNGGGYCCNGEDISAMADAGQTQHNYIIAAAWSDLFTLGQNAYYLGTQESATFGWYGVFEYYDPNNLNSFEIELYSSGNIDLRYGGIDIVNHNVSAGITGDLSQGEYVDLYYGQGFSLGSPINPDSGEGPDPCDSNPLSSPSCSGYQQAYYSQQCSISALYDTGCPGYQAAYYNQQCSISPLYDVGCPGYQSAYYNQQCSLNALYDSGCPGYQVAYYNQQCSISPLYDVGCDGYEQAYYNQRCSNNALYDVGCTGYAAALFQQNCSADQLFDSECPGFSIAMAMKIAQEQQEKMFEQEFAVSLTAIENVAETTGDPVLDQLLSILPEPIELASMQDEIVQTIVVEQIAASEPMEEPTSEDQVAAEEMMAELVGEKSSDGEDKSTTGEKPSAEKQKAAVAAKIAELKKEMASGEMSAKDVAAIQAQISMLLAFVPGFDQYYIVMPDSPFYQQEQAYKNVTIPDSKNSARLGLASEMKFNEMVQMQYNRRK